MFFFQRNYFNEARGQHLKIFFYHIFMVILATISVMAIPVIVAGVGIGFSREDNFAPIIFGMIFGILIFLVGVVFFLTPLQYSLYAYYMYGYKKKEVKFRDGLFLFKKGIYWKSLGLFLLLLLMMIAISSLVSGVIYGIGFGILSAFGAGSTLFDPDTIETFNTGTTMAIVSVQLLLTFLQIVANLLVMISMAMIGLNHMDQPENTLGDKFSKGLSIAFRSSKDLLKLFFSNVLLNLVPFLIMFVFAILAVGVGIMNLGESGTLGLSVLIVGLFVISLIVSGAFVAYLQTGSFISYYFEGRNAYENKLQREDELIDAQHITTGS